MYVDVPITESGGTFVSTKTERGQFEIIIIIKEFCFNLVIIASSIPSSSLLYRNPSALITSVLCVE